LAARKALLVVDVQRDFCPGGAVAVKGGDEVVPKLNKVIEAFAAGSLPVFFSRDWHPPNHISFKANGGIWPPHCVKGTLGAGFHPKLEIPQEAVVVSKGTIAGSEAYSAFQGTDLEKRLRTIGVEEIFVGGIATDYCVKESVLDALTVGLRVNVIEDGVRGVDRRPDDSGVALQEVATRGARLVSASDAVRLVTHCSGFEPQSSEAGLLEDKKRRTTRRFSLPSEWQSSH